MPILKSAKKKMKQDATRKARNLSYKKKYKRAVKEAVGPGKKTQKKDLSKAYSAIDRAKKAGIIEKNKAARLKSRVAKVVSKAK